MSSSLPSPVSTLRSQELRYWRPILTLSASLAHEWRSMATDVRVPTTGNAGEDAVVLEWNVTEGSDVTAGDVLVTLETAKATIDVEAPISGHVLRTFYTAGDEVART